MKLLPIFLLSFYLSTAASCQTTGFVSPYKLSYGVDIPAGTVGLGLNFAYYLLDKKTEPLTEAALALQDPLNIPKIDRSAAYNWSKGAALGSDVILFSSISYP